MLTYSRNRASGQRQNCSRKMDVPPAPELEEDCELLNAPENAPGKEPPPSCPSLSLANPPKPIPTPPPLPEPRGAADGLFVAEELASSIGPELQLEPG